MPPEGHSLLSAQRRRHRISRIPHRLRLRLSLHQRGRPLLCERAQVSGLPASRRRDLAIAAGTAGFLLAIYLLRLDPVVGQFEDDAWYLILAKSLATGHGYNLINLPQHSGLYFYPPLFPF